MILFQIIGNVPSFEILGSVIAPTTANITIANKEMIKIAKNTNAKLVGMTFDAPDPEAINPKDTIKAPTKEILE